MQYLPLLALYGGAALAQLTTTTAAPATSASGSGDSTINLYGFENTVNLYAASVVTADQGSTVYAVVCSTGILSCYTNVPFTVTQGPSTVTLSTSASEAGVTAVLEVDCDVHGTTSASCIYSLSAKSGGTSESTKTTVTYTGNPIPGATVVITAGQDKIAAASTIPAHSPTGNTAARPSVMGPVAERTLFVTLAGGAAAAFLAAVLL